MPEEDGLEPELGRSWARLGQYLFFSVGARRWKKVQSVGGLHFFTRGTEEKKLACQAGRLLVGPGRAGLGRGQAEANEDDPEQWPGWAAPVVFFAGYGKSQLMAQHHIYI